LVYVAHLAGPITRVVAQTRRFIDDRDGQPSDLEDSVGVLADFESGATGVFESTKLATGRGEGRKSPRLLRGQRLPEDPRVSARTRPRGRDRRSGGTGLGRMPVPGEFLKWPGSTRDS